MSRRARTLCLATLAAGAAIAASAATAATIEVSYDPAASFSDAGRTPDERARNLAALAAHLKTLASRLPAGDQVLQVRLLDLDLAGSLRPSARFGGEVRVVRGGADWPRIRLSYTLSEGGQVSTSGEDHLSDLNYAWREPAMSSVLSDPLRHEKKLLDDWVTSRFGPAAGSP